MKVLVANLRSNPFRTEKYPYNPEKIKQLESNIKATSFWDNILARPKAAEPGIYEIAYGHHRIKALKNLAIKEIDIPIRDLDDAIMLKIMAQENMEEWDQSPLVGMETVKAAYNFLKSHGTPEVTGEKTHEIIAGFLSWPPKRVMHSIANLRSAGEIDLEGIGASKDVIHVPVEVFKILPTQKHAEAFRGAVRATKASPRVQKEVAKEVAKGSADKNEAIRLIEEKQKELGETVENPKSEIEMRGDAIVYRNKLAQAINIIPTNPPKHLTEDEYHGLKKMALVIINRLRRFEDGEQSGEKKGKERKGLKA